jgi:uncharacterized membrane protein
MSTDPLPAPNPAGHRRTLGFCWLVYGVIRLVMTVSLALFSGTATVMFGALLPRVPDPFALMNTFHLIYMAAIVLGVLCGLLGVVAGSALLAGQASGRTLALVVGFLSLSDVPLGTTLGIYTLVIFLR